MDNWTGHYHGFGPWTGTRDEFHKEHLRRPGRDPIDQQTRDFLAGDMTPVQLGQELLRRTKVAPERTWTDVEEALDWFGKTWVANPPGGDVLSLNKTIEYSRGHLLRGSDICAGYYTPGFSFVSFSIICCPNRFFPDIPCPLPPRQT